MGKRKPLARRAPQAPPLARPPDVPGGKRCAHCDRSLPREAFNPSTSLLDGLSAWCRECAAKLDGGTAELLRAWHRDHNREYQRARRHRLGPAYILARVSVDGGRGTLRLRWSRSRTELKITGRYDLHEDSARIFVRAFGVPLGKVLVRGRGGGSGVRRQKTFFTTGPVTEDAWNRGVTVLQTAGMLKGGL